MMVRMFHIDCDKCNSGELGDTVTSAEAIQVARDAGYHLKGNIAICPECWDNGTRLGAV